MALRRCLISTIIVTVTTVAAAAAQQYDPEDYYSHLDSVYALGDKKLEGYLIRELETFVIAHHDHPKAPDAALLLARLWEDRGDRKAALIRYVKTMFLFPGSEAAALAAEGRDRMMAEVNEYDLELLTPPTGADTTAQDDFSARRFAFLRSIYTLGDKDLAEWLQGQLHEFMQDYPEFGQIEALHLWSAELYALDGSKHKARAAYDRYTALFPNDENLPLVRTRLGVLLEEQFGDKDAAYETYGQVIQNWPESEHSAHALIRRAELAENDRRDYRAAIDDYRLLITKWPKHERAIEALYEIAKIKEEKLDAHISAIETYNEFVRSYPDEPRAIEALKQSSEIYSKKLGDFASAAKQLARIGREYPEHKEAIPMLIEASEMAVDKLKDYDLAIGFLKQITETFRDRPEARQAQLRINKLMIAKTESERNK